MATLCKTCKKLIRFLKTSMGKLIPVDAETCDLADEYFDRERHRTHFQRLKLIKSQYTMTHAFVSTQYREWSARDAV